MGKINYFTKVQAIILEEFKKDKFLRSHFYFTGGTALSGVYLHHRESEDLDFFTPNTYERLLILNKITRWSKDKKFNISDRSNELLQTFQLEFPKGEILKVDFNHYPYKRVKKGTFIDNIDIDSLLDIAINKLVTIYQRTQVKDFVDLYFLLKKFTIWDLIEGVSVKFRIKLELVMIAGDFLKVEQFDILPKMLVPLSLKELKDFYKDQAKKLGMKVVKK